MPAEARVGCVHTQDRVSGPHAISGPAVDPPPEQIEEEWTYRLGEMQLPVDLRLRLYQVKRGLAASPNAAGVSFDYSSPTGSRTWSTPPATQAGGAGALPHRKADEPALLYHVSPDAPAGARALSPQEVASWLVTTNDAKLAFRMRFMAWPAVRRSGTAWLSRAARTPGWRDLSPRARQHSPPSDEALVGTYLKSLPDDGSADLADETTPTVE